jgi:hypothetical protein
MMVKLKVHQYIAHRITGTSSNGIKMVVKAPDDSSAQSISNYLQILELLFWRILNSDFLFWFENLIV